MARREKGLEKKQSSLKFSEISPPHRWDQDLASHYLRLTVPGFATKDITLHMDKYGHLVVRGTRQVTEHKYLSFEETFDIPDDADLEQADGMFEDDHIYCVVIPKNKRLGQRYGDGVSESKGAKLEDHEPKKGGKFESEGAKFEGHEPNKGNKGDSIIPKHGIGSQNQPSRPSPVIQVDKRIALLVAILIAIYAAWLSRES